MPKAIPIISAFHNLSAGDLADEHGHLSGQIADLETRKRAIAGKVIRRGVSECEGALFRSVLIGKAMVCTLDRAGIEKAMGEAWVARFHRLACEHAPEGIVSKRINGRYEPDRRSWLKTKCLNREEFVVVGWSDPEGSRHRIGALLLGYYTPAGDLVYAGRACTGLPERELER